MMWYGPAWGWRMTAYGGGWHMAFGALFWLAFVVLAIVALRAFASGRRGEERSPLAVLQSRYAKGEIGRDEFLEKKRDLSAPVA